MNEISIDVGTAVTLRNRIRKAIIMTGFALTLTIGGAFLVDSELIAGGESRTISLYHVHTKESITVTYMQNGRYVPSAMKKINYLMRDWRRKQTVTIDPKTLDLMWELHADLGSRRPIHIVCGYRSGSTNAFLKRIGRNVAKHSQHTKGKAIDFYFPDISTSKIRNAALYRKVGGVGYYRSSGGPSGFLHVDTGKVRHWGPKLNKSQMIAALGEGKKAAGRRLARSGGSTTTPPATVSSGSLLSWFKGKPKQSELQQVAVATKEKIEEPAYTELNYEGFDEDLSDLAADVAEPEVIAKKSDPSISTLDSSTLGVMASVEMAEADDGSVIKKGYPVPKPRLKPVAVMMMAAAKIKITPVSATPELEIKIEPSQVSDNLNRIESSETITADETIEDSVNLAGDQTTNRDGKSDFAAEFGTDTEAQKPLMRPVLAASLAVDDFELWKSLIIGNEAKLRQDGTPPTLDRELTTVLPTTASGELAPPANAQVVNREGKSSMPRLTIKLSQIRQ